MNERLEGIKEWFYADEELHQFQIEWLIEQAEQLHGKKGKYGYRDMYGICNRDYANLNSKNKLMKQTLEKYAMTSYGSLAKETLNKMEESE